MNKQLEARSKVRSWLVAAAVGSSVGCGTEGPTEVVAPGVDRIATFQVTFNGTWSANTHPASFPPGPHFSGLIGGTHNDAFVMWQADGLASTGIKDMAELGAKSALSGEVEAAIEAGTAWSVLSGAGINPSPASVSLTFEAHSDYPLVSLVSMIAPSPDWFVGVSGLELMENGQWLASVTVDLLPYDGGTDSGGIYTSANSATTPPAPIRRLTEIPFDMDLPLGMFTFIRTDSS